MSKNILIFSDGTGQAGGLRFDEDRSNVYKLFRATRVGPDSCINPSEQVAFYDPGLGSQADGSNLWGRGFRRAIYNTVSQVTGFGITANIVDCYAAIIRLYEDDDRIFLFGFSRGAYTVRCLAGVLAHCGIPRNLPGDQPLKRDVPASQALAAYAVKHIYQFTETRKKDETNAYQEFLQSTRALIAKRFREQHKSFDSQNPENANVYPYFIGVFDTVAALGNWKKSVLFLMAFLIGALVVSFILSLLPLFLDAPILGYLTIKNVFTTLVIAAAAIALFLYLYTHIKFDFGVPGYSWWQKIKTFHLTSMWQTFYDRSLNPNVQYAKHAISIDESRSDFQRVEWSRFPSRSVRDDHGNIWFEQIWFPGSHADVGGSYNENESRLSDGALKWMLACASVIPNGIKHDRSALQLFPDSAGMQHDERKAGLGLLTRRFNVTWRKQDRVLPIPEGEMKSKATMHKSVYDRFDLPDVLQHDCRCIYRPETLRNHVDFCDGYLDDGTTRARPNRTRNEAAVDTEAKFDKLMKARAAVADARGGKTGESPKSDSS
jgi:uncharacterized protein (DUF2235 family)